MGWVSRACGFPDGSLGFSCGLVFWVSSLRGFCVGWVDCEFVLVVLLRLGACVGVCCGFDLCFSLGWVSGILVGLLILMFALGWCDLVLADVRVVWLAGWVWVWFKWFCCLVIFCFTPDLVDFNGFALCLLWILDFRVGLF